MAKPKIQRINISLPEELHTKAKGLAVLKGVTLNDYFSEAISHSVKQKKEELKLK